jgi:hypothetical protein
MSKEGGAAERPLDPLLDMDLRDAATRARCKVPTGWGEAERARSVAIQKINWSLQELQVRGIAFTLTDLNMTLEARSVLTGKGE